MEPLQHPSRYELEKYAARGLQPAELIAVDDHLAACESCRRAVAEQLPRGRFVLDDEDLHLSYEELEALVPGGDHEHLRECPMCAAELRDLRSLTISKGRGNWWLPAGAALAAALAIGV